MKYNEFYKDKKYKIRHKRKSYDFRDALILYLNNENFVDQDKSELIIKETFNLIKMNEIEIDQKNRVIITKEIALEMAKKDLFVKNTKLFKKIIKFWKKNKIISSRSIDTLKIHIEHDPNKLTRCFINSHFYIHDAILDLRDIVVEKISNAHNREEEDLYLFYYLQLFSIKSYDKDLYMNFFRSNFVNLDGTVVLIYEKKYSDKYTAVKIEYFDRLLNSFLPLFKHYC